MVHHETFGTHSPYFWHREEITPSCDIRTILLLRAETSIVKHCRHVGVLIFHDVQFSSSSSSRNVNNIVCCINVGAQ